MKNSKLRLKQLILISLFSAVALICVFLVRLPMFEFLEYDPKDIVIVLGGLILGPLPAAAMVIIVSFIHTFVFGSTGIIGFLMEVFASVAFCIPLCLCYHRNKTRNNLYIGFLLGSLCMTATMLLWNLFLTPIYLGIPREAVHGILWTVILPFNIGKSLVNSLGILILYKPVLKASKYANIE